MTTTDARTGAEIDARIEARIDADALARALPPLSGEVALEGLARPITIHRDAWGIPHVRAEGGADAWFGLGFVHAQDRLFQMDLNRRRALGRAAEWLGPAAADGDVLVRRLGMAGACRRDHDALGPEARAMLDAYARGVNAFLASGAPLPVEYALLGAAAEPWEPWHAIAVMRRLGLLMGSVWFKLWRALALPIVGPETAGKLRYDDGGRDRLCIPPGLDAARWSADLAALGPAVTALLEAMGAESGEGTGGGSNNWALGPSRTATGRPILAGDPHRAFEIPNMYAQAHVACEASDARGAFDVIGLTVPGVPGFPHFAHNGHVAYCVTHAFMDIHDLFLERFADGGGRALFRGEWEPTRRATETVAVRGASDRRVEIVETRHGPVIAGDPASGAALAIRSVQFAETDRSFDCLPRMATARTVADLYEATRGWGLIDHNLVAGDVAGAIGHLVRAEVPRRPRAHGWLPMPGWTGEYEWTGWIAREDMPLVIDPPGGVIVTANNRVVADDGPDYLCTDCHPPYRARRIAALIEERGPFRVEDAAALHADALSPHAALFRERLAALAPRPEPGAEAARRRLAAWDGRMDSGSEAAALHNRFRRALTRVATRRGGLDRAVRHPWAAVPPGISPEGQVWWALPTLLREDDACLLGGGTWDEALAEALAEIAAAPGENAPDGEAWGEAHRPRPTHPLSPLFPEAAHLLDPPSRPIGGDGDCVLATGLVPSAGPAATYGALARYVFDVGDWERCRWSVFHGASGHPGSSHYADQNAAWSACEMVPMLYDRRAVEAGARATQVLRQR